MCGCAARPGTVLVLEREVSYKFVRSVLYTGPRMGPLARLVSGAHSPTAAFAAEDIKRVVVF